MTQATIRCCPDSPTILDFTEDVVVSLLGRDIQVEVVDGTQGEFSVLVDGEAVVVNRGGRLPDIEDVVEAVSEAGAAYLGV